MGEVSFSQDPSASCVFCLPIRLLVFWGMGGLYFGVLYSDEHTVSAKHIGLGCVHHTWPIP